MSLHPNYQHYRSNSNTSNRDYRDRDSRSRSRSRSRDPPRSPSTRFHDDDDRNSRDEKHQPPSISEITPHLYLGDFPSSISIPTLMSCGITAMVSLSSRFSNEWDRPANRMLVPEVDHLYVKCLDTPDQDILAFLEEICDFIDRHVDSQPDVLKMDLKSMDDAQLEMLEKQLSGGHQSVGGTDGKVLVHCSQGVSRSGAVVVGYLMRKEKKGVRAALAEVRMRRSKVDPREEFLEQLEIWGRCGYHVWEREFGSTTGKKKPKAEYKRWLEHHHGGKVF
ncbi:protein-tyrosine phosphatase-like protein [Apodospora peruviana]|uniref:protein-tyrosine-phosphatase n=1 Tax=Apodospora peruviana TaxID=516989 RepID=A0AAE0ITW3_9PEZI|nr:protein-tyrosine phosphatase-like protein [Apodospora peruviana]